MFELPIYDTTLNATITVSIIDITAVSPLLTDILILVAWDIEIIIPSYPEDELALAIHSQICILFRLRFILI